MLIAPNIIEKYMYGYCMPNIIQYLHHFTSIVISILLETIRIIRVLLYYTIMLLNIKYLQMYINYIIQITSYTHPT